MLAYAPQVWVSQGSCSGRGQWYKGETAILLGKAMRATCSAQGETAPPLVDLRKRWSVPLWPGWLANLLPQASSAVRALSEGTGLSEGFSPSQVWWHTPLIPTLGKGRQENQEFDASFIAGFRSAWTT